MKNNNSLATAVACWCAAAVVFAAMQALGADDAVPPAGSRVVAGGPVAATEPAAARIAPVLAEMRARGGDFSPAALSAMGLDGLSALLDWLLPATARPVPPEATDRDAAAWVKQLGDDNFGKREAASQKLARMGVPAYPAVVAAAGDKDAEVGLRARRILKAWEAEKARDKQSYTAAFATYAAGIEDQARIAEMADRVKRLLASVGPPPSGIEGEITRQCIGAVTRVGKDPALVPLAGLVSPGNLPIARFVLGAVAQGATPEYCPAVLLETLGSDRADLVQAVLGCWPDCRKSAQAGEIQQRLRTMMEGPRDELKPLACRVLFQQFDHPAAVDYLVRELERPGDLGRRLPAFQCLLDARSRGKTLAAPLVKTLGKLTQDKDMSNRFHAAQALANYRGEEIVKLLIPLLGDSAGKAAAQRGLQDQTDRDMVRKALDEAASQHPDQKVRDHASQYLKEWDAGKVSSGSSRRLSGSGSRKPRE